MCVHGGARTRSFKLHMRPPCIFKPFKPDFPGGKCLDKSHLSHGNILYMPPFVENAEFIIMWSLGGPPLVEMYTQTKGQIDNLMNFFLLTSTRRPPGVRSVP